MFNKTNIITNEAVSNRQILASVDHQQSVGCVVPASLGVDVNGVKIVKAGTPLIVDFKDLTKEAVDGGTEPNAILLHDVNVSKGANNGTALYHGTVNINRVDTDVQEKLTAITGGSPLLVIVKL